MNCREFHDELNALRDLRAAAPDALREHASGCETCARELRAEEALLRGLHALRQENERLVLPRGLARDARRIAAGRRPARFVAPIAAGIALAAGIVAATVLFVAPGHRATAIPSLHAGPTSAPLRGSAALPVVYSDGSIDIVGPESGVPASAAAGQRGDVAVLVEWNL